MIWEAGCAWCLGFGRKSYAAHCCDWWRGFVPKLVLAMAPSRTVGDGGGGCSCGGGLYMMLLATW